ncbi:hypothetical protein DUNSADRAFT_2432 [Dunaliella salina]|uniref:MYND-type domain-containing protein n=1 Tax=Dunaliella salina TaxID=3046 RepID=A0ABZ3LB70_DUNSA|nr:hypothetical protein DUNSADRAFT_2432 [Dunaliella salina]|eukprot:KAF5838668.1 hypothetical protein DUNSADRAFT_2432 [Dunaliella salina]
MRSQDEMSHTKGILEIRCFMACVLSKTPVYNHTRAALLSRALTPCDCVPLIQLLSTILSELRRDTFTEIPQQQLLDEWWSDANLHQIRWDKENITSCLHVLLEVQDNFYLEQLCSGYLINAYGTPSLIRLNPASRRRPLDQVLQDPACMSQLWQALSSRNRRVQHEAVSVLRYLVSEGRTCAWTEAAKHPGNCPPSCSFSSLMQMGEAEPLTAALQQLAQQKRQERQQQRQQKQGRLLPSMPSEFDYVPGDTVADLMEALENAWVCEAAYSLRHTLHGSSLTFHKDTLDRDVPVFCVEGSDEQKKLEADSSIPAWLSKLLEAHMSLVLGELDFVANNDSEFLSGASWPRLLSPCRVSTSHLTQYPRASHAAAARYLEDNPRAIAALMKYMLKVAEVGMCSKPASPSKPETTLNHTYNPRSSFCVCLMRGMAFKEAARASWEDQHSTYTIARFREIFTEAHPGVAPPLLQPNQKDYQLLHRAEGCDGSMLVSACASLALQLLNDVCSTANGLACFKSQSDDANRVVAEMWLHVGCPTKDGNLLLAAAINESSKQAISSACREGGSCSGKDAHSSLQKAGERGVSSSSIPDIAQRGDQGNSSSSSSSSSAATKTKEESISNSISVKVGSLSSSGSTSNSTCEQAPENGSSSSDHATALGEGRSNTACAMPAKVVKQSKVSQACVQCGKTGKLKRCARCGQALVCSEVCQKAFWPTHEPACKRSIL